MIALGSLYLGEEVNPQLPGAGTSLPTFFFRWSPTTNPRDTPVWEDMTPYVMDFSFTRGRNFELNRMEAGTATLTLDNTLRLFDPTNPDSPYYGNILPMKKFRAYCTFGRAIWYLFTGYIEEWQQTWENPDWAEVQLTVVDAFEQLALNFISTSFPVQTSGQRINAILDQYDVMWPAEDRIIGTGYSNVAAATFDTSSTTALLTHIHDVEAGEVGYIIANSQGQIQFCDRYYRLLNPTSNVSQAIFGDDAAVTELEYTALTPSFDKTLIYNAVDVTSGAPSAVTQFVEDSTSETKYFSRHLSQTTVLASDSDAHDVAQYLLAIYKDPVLRFKDMTFQPLSDTTGLWQAAVQLQVGDRITVRRRPPNFSTNYPTGTATVSGYEITDATRAAALAWGTSQQGGSTDGATVPAGFGVWEAGTNLFRRGQCDTTGDMGGTGGGSTTYATDAMVPAPFSPQSIKATTDGTANNQGIYCYSGTGLAAATGVVGVGSVYFKGVAGQSYDVIVGWNNTDASQTVGSITTVTATGSWQNVAPASIAVAAGKTGDRLWIIVRTHTQRAESFWVAHAMLQKGVSVVSPYIATSGGSTASRTAALVQALASLVSTSQMWVALRVRLGVDFATLASGGRFFFNWRDSSSGHRIEVNAVVSGGNKVRVGRSAASGNSQDSAVVTNVAGDEITVIAKFTASQIGISVNGSAFSLAANTSIPNLSAVPLFDIGARSAPFSDAWVDSSVLWFACGTGTLSDGDAYNIYSLSNNGSTLSPSKFPGTCTMFWPAVTSTYDLPFGTSADYMSEDVFIEQINMKLNAGSLEGEVTYLLSPTLGSQYLITDETPFGTLDSVYRAGL